MPCTRLARYDFRLIDSVNAAYWKQQSENIWAFCSCFCRAADKRVIPRKQSFCCRLNENQRGLERVHGAIFLFAVFKSSGL